MPCMSGGGRVQCVLLLIGGAIQGAAQGPGSLKQVRVPEPAGIERYVNDHEALLVMGKALFWDVQVGSDNRTACATCHFHAGADHRIQNQLASPQDASRTVPLNHVLTPAEYPFHLLADPLNRNSAVVR